MPYLDVAFCSYVLDQICEHVHTCTSMVCGLLSFDMFWMDVCNCLDQKSGSGSLQILAASCISSCCILVPWSRLWCLLWRPSLEESYLVLCWRGPSGTHHVMAKFLRVIRSQMWIWARSRVFLWVVLVLAFIWALIAPVSRPKQWASWAYAVIARMRRMCASQCQLDAMYVHDCTCSVVACNIMQPVATGEENTSFVWRMWWTVFFCFLHMSSLLSVFQALWWAFGCCCVCHLCAGKGGVVEIAGSGLEMIENRWRMMKIVFWCLLVSFVFFCILLYSFCTVYQECFRSLWNVPLRHPHCDFWKKHTYYLDDAFYWRMRREAV